MATGSPGLASEPVAADAAVDAAIACIDIADPAARLACLDAAATKLKETRIIREEDDAAGFQAADARDAGPLPTISSAETEVDAFGAERVESKRTERERERLNELTAAVVEARVNRFGVITVTLDNGQVWRQLDSDGDRVRLREGTLYNVRIKRGAVGGYRGKFLELGRTIRMKRIK